MNALLRTSILLIAVVGLSCGTVDSADQPVARFRASCVRIVDSTVAFTDESLHAESYEWEFGNGATSNLKEPTVVYRAPGVYRVVLTVRNANGDADRFEKALRVYPDIPATRILDVPFRAQEVDWWSWAAACEMVLQFDSTYVQQCRIVSDSYRTNCCDDPEGCRFYWSMERIQDALAAEGGLSSESRNAPLTMGEIREEIAQERPVIVSLEDVVRNYGHLVVIYGYDEPDLLYIHDPALGSVTLHYEEGFGVLGGNGFEWARTIYCIAAE